MRFVSWESATRRHVVSFTKSGGAIYFDPATMKVTSNAGVLTTKCGEIVPHEHESSTAIEVKEICQTCWRTKES